MSNLRILLCGQSGVGKTVSAATFIEAGRVRWYAFEDGFRSALSTKAPDGSPLIPNADKIELVPLFVREKSKLDFKTHLGKGQPPPHAKLAPKIMDDYERAMDEDFSNPPTTLVVDSLTRVIATWCNAALMVNGKPHLDKSDYGTLKVVLFEQFIPSLVALAEQVKYVIVITHTIMITDSDTGITKEFPIATSKNTSPIIGAEFDEVWYQTRSSDKFHWHTAPHQYFKSAKSRLDLPKKLEASYQGLLPHVT